MRVSITRGSVSTSMFTCELRVQVERKVGLTVFDNEGAPGSCGVTLHRATTYADTCMLFTAVAAADAAAFTNRPVTINDVDSRFICCPSEWDRDSAYTSLTPLTIVPKG